MKKFLEVLKMNISDEISNYFVNVEVESIKKVENKDALNFYLVSKDIMPYAIVKKAEKEIAKGLFNLDKNEYINGETVTIPVTLKFRYEIDEKWSCKYIYEQIRRDLFKELAEKKHIAYSLIREEYVEFTDENTLRLGLDHILSLKKYQDELVNYFKELFKERFNRKLNVDILWLENTFGTNSRKNRKGSADIEKNENNAIDVNIRRDVVKNESVSEKSASDVVDLNSVNSHIKNRFTRKTQITIDGDLLYGRATKIKKTFREIPKLLYEMDNIETSGVIYNKKVFKKEDENKSFAIYSIYITDGEGCIEVKFFDSKDAEELFHNRFCIGDEVRVEGKVKNDFYARALVIDPSLVFKLGKRTIVEHGTFGSDDYYNEIITDRVDEEKVKRVELHLHTKSSAQDGIGDVEQYILTAKRFGMDAMAITDHGCVNSLADARDYLKKIKDDSFKIINGVEGYLVEDVDAYYYDSRDHEIYDSFSLSGRYVVYSLVTTGFNKLNDSIIKIVANKIENYKVIDKFSEFVYTDKPLTLEVKDRTKILPSNIENAMTLKSVLESFVSFAKDSVLVTESKNSTWKLNEILLENGFNGDFKFLDFSILARLTLTNLKKANILSIAKELDVKIDGITTRKKENKKSSLGIDDNLKLQTVVFTTLLYRISAEYAVSDLKDLHNKVLINDNFIRRQKYYHIILLAKNDVGRVNLYKIVSDSHIRFMYDRKPRIPRLLLTKYREGLIVGSACILGEFMDAIKNGQPDYKLKEIASFYDYLEIQPVLNNSFLLNKEPENFKTIDDLKNLVKKVVDIGDELDKIVVATCDCHYVEKTDKIYREILRNGIMGKKSNLDREGNIKVEVSSELEDTNLEELYFRTTKEMLDEFEFLGIDKAYEVVVKNTNLINDMVEKIYPIRLDNCPPHIEGSDEELTQACYDNLHKLYGDNPPNVIKERLDNELKYIIDNGYSVMYIAAKKLIDYSKENGYPVGSRGSVGSSLAATLAGVSEVNPLKPHYVCRKCHHIEYDTEETRKYDNDTGYDMPDKECTICGTKMSKEGMNIPFETFLGIPNKAQKEPDIDLNFCSIFQSKIHEKTVDLFGKENTFKAGTVGTVASKTAYGYVMKFKEMTGIDLNSNQVDYYKNKIVGCKNSTGQHPGGMVVVPDGESIYTFTPVQIAADKEGNDITTHYDYHKIDKNLLKLDLLGHVSPLILKRLQEYTGVPFSEVPFYEKDVLELFKSTESIGISPSDISGTKLGCLTIPEFGTDIAIGMCLDAKPRTVADLIRISGLAHGEDIWRGNVQDLIKNGDCTLSTAICCRDDIMIFLVEKGIDSGTAFTIMERVRKGKKLTDEYRDIMRVHEVPEWYIGCCDKIKYMFPKAHAAAYVLASLRIAYYKVHYPREYYAVYFSNNKDGFDYKLMMKDKDEIHYRIEKIAKIINDRKKRDKKFASEIEIKNNDTVKKTYNKLSGITEDSKMDGRDEEINLNEQYDTMSATKLFDLYMCYRHVEEMKARGIDFCPIDLYKAKRSDFQVIDDKIMPSFDSLNGIGTKEYDIDYNDEVPKEQKSTAMKCEIEGRNGEYTSIENFINRTGTNKTRIAEMKELGLFDGMKEKEETTIFDYLSG